MEEIFKKYGFDLDKKSLDLFKKFLDIFIKKNSLINLSAIRDKKDIIEKHFIDSLFLTKFIKIKGKILDLGTGGGFPGIPLKIFCEEEDEFVLIDSIGKKIVCVNEFVKELNLQNIYGIKSRFEDLAKDKNHIKNYDLIVSRATAYLPDLINYSIPFLKKDGILAFYKLENNEEIENSNNFLQKLNLEIFDKKYYQINGQERIILFIKKL